MARSQFTRRACASLLLTALLTASVLAARPSEDLLPAMTKVYVTVPDLDDLQKSWEATQLGQLTNDPVMQPFVEDLKRQIRARMSQTGIRLGITWEDLQGVASGEVAFGVIQPNGDKARSATVLLADITDRAEKANALLQKISRDLVARGSEKGTVKMGAVDFTSFALPKKKVTDRQLYIYYGTLENQLIVADDAEVAKEIVGRFVGEHTNTLRHLQPFIVTQERSEKGFEAKSQLRWYVDPFGYAETVRAYAGGRKKRGTDLLKVLHDQGFNCVQGLGGRIALATNEHELRHQTFIYAPPVERPAGSTNTDKYDLAARMLDFPESEKMEPQDFIPKRLATYLTFNWKLQKAFWQSETLVNEIAGAEVFRDVLNDIEKDPNGPQINVDQEFVRFLGERVTVISDYREPIDTKSERVLLAIEVNNPAAVMAAVNKTMRSDRNAKKITVKDHIIWEMTQEEEFAVEEIKIDGLDLGGLGGQDVDNGPNEKEIEFHPNAAVTVAHGYFLIGTHVDYVVSILDDLGAESRLSDASDYQRVSAALTKLGAKSDSFRCFTRTDDSYRVTYEMVRQGKMPEAESLLAKILNGMFTPDDEEAVRQQQIDGSKLPEFDLVKAYLGPAGFYSRSQPDGWFVSGCLLSKPAQ